MANGLAYAFLDGYDELREKIFASFPDIDVSGFMPIETEVPENGDGGSGEVFFFFRKTVHRLTFVLILL